MRDPDAAPAHAGEQSWDVRDPLPVARHRPETRGRPGRDPEIGADAKAIWNGLWLTGSVRIDALGTARAVVVGREPFIRQPEPVPVAEVLQPLHVRPVRAHDVGPVVAAAWAEAATLLVEGDSASVWR